MIKAATKRCSKCEAEKAVTEFPPRHPWCRGCKRVYDRDWARRRYDRRPRETKIRCARCDREFQRQRANAETRKTGVCARCRSRKGERAQYDHDAIIERLKSGVLYRTVAQEFGCNISTVKVIAWRNGLQRATKRPAPTRSAWRAGKARQLVEEYGGDHIAAAAEAYRRAARWQKERETGVVSGGFRDATADDVVGLLTKDLKEQVRLMNRAVNKVGTIGPLY